VGQLYDIKLKIEAKIKAGKLDEKEIKGKIALKSGKLLAFINATTPDDPESVTKMKQAVQEVLHLTV